MPKLMRKRFAIRTERPSVKPVIVVMKKLIGVVVAPIAESESSPSVFPTIKASAQLYSCCNIPLNISGRLKLTRAFMISLRF